MLVKGQEGEHKLYFFFRIMFNYCKRRRKYNGSRNFMSLTFKCYVGQIYFQGCGFALKIFIKTENRIQNLVPM